RGFGSNLADAVESGDLDEKTVDDQARRLLTVFSQLGVLDGTDTPAEDAVEAVTGDAVDALVREAAAEATVLLRNEGVLPIDRGAVRRIALIGANAHQAVIMGGGSANLTPQYRVSPSTALRRVFPDAEVVAERGVVIDKTIPSIPSPVILEFFA